MTTQPPRPIHRDWRFWVLTSGGLGLSPVAPGTFGTLGGVAIAALLPPNTLGIAIGIATILVCAFLCVRLGAWAESVWGKDPSCVVLDEVLGYLTAVIPFIDSGPTALVCAFFVFRFFDTVKPPPIRRFELLPGGWGVLSDDALAGVYSVVILAILDFGGVLG